MSATDSDHEQVSERDGTTWIIPKLEQDEEGWAITLLKTAKRLSGITLQRYTVSHLQPGWRYISQDNFDPVQNILENLRVVAVFRE